MSYLRALLKQAVLAARKRPDWRTQAASVEFDDTSISVRSPAPRVRNVERSIRWERVSRAIAFKRDLLVTDLVCIRLEAVDGDPIELNEEMSGWDEAINSMASHLPGALDASLVVRAVTLPAFETNETTFYERTPKHAV